jgi:hypothetical protein
MAMRQAANKAGIYQPAEIVLLGRVFDKLVNPRDDDDAREALASRILGYYLAGIRDEDELCTVSKLPLGR